VKAVNVRQLKTNPSQALRLAREGPLVVMNRDEPEALLVHLDDETLLSEQGIRLALATALYKSESVSLGRAARLARVALVDFIQYVSRLGIPAVRGTRAAVRQDTRTLEAWLKQESSSATRAR
jgi:antitoxin (DNA-binding transcriptional repressor) of toxin-antitoxin stability system